MRWAQRLESCLIECYCILVNLRRRGSDCMPCTPLKQMLRASDVERSSHHTLGGLGARFSGDELQALDIFEPVGTWSSKR